MATPTSTRGQNFNSAELRQVIISWVSISGCPIIGGNQKNAAFWDRVARDYNNNRPRGTQERVERSLESKWSDVKHDVAKFSGAYSNVEDLRISGTSAEDTLVRARELYSQKHPKHKSFAFKDCWMLLKNNPKWAQTVDDMATKATSKGNSKKRKGQPTDPAPPSSPTEIVNPTSSNQNSQQSELPIGANDETSDWQQRPIGNKSAKNTSKNWTRYTN